MNLKDRIENWIDRAGEILFYLARLSGLIVYLGLCAVMVAVIVLLFHIVYYLITDMAIIIGIASGKAHYDVTEEGILHAVDVAFLANLVFLLIVVGYNRFVKNYMDTDGIFGESIGGPIREGREQLSGTVRVQATRRTTTQRARPPGAPISSEQPKVGAAPAIPPTRLGGNLPLGRIASSQEKDLLLVDGTIRSSYLRSGFTWLRGLHFEDLKIKVAFSIVIISTINLLGLLLRLGANPNMDEVVAKCVLQLVLLVSAVVVALSNYETGTREENGTREL